MKTGNTIDEILTAFTGRVLKIFVLVLLLIFTGCSRPEGRHREKSTKPAAGLKEEIRYATGFSMTDFTNFKVLEVKKPWQGAEDIHFRYILTHKRENVPDSILKTGALIKLPVNRVVCTSTTHIAFLEALGKTDLVVGVSGAGLITNKKIRNGIDAGTIRDIGYGRELNFELLVSLRPDVVILYGVESEMTGLIHKLNDLGIAVVMNAEYLEKEPLGKMEWIKFIAAFFGLEENANNLFDSVATRYENLRDTVSREKYKPVVMTGLPWKDVWYVSPGNTVVASYIHAAGGRYLWDDLIAQKAVPMDMESVYMKARNAEFWINSGTAGSIQQILNADARFSHFPPVVSGKVYNNIAKVNATGGNDYWESGVVHPDIVLLDLISIFHPDQVPDRKLVYYKELK